MDVFKSWLRIALVVLVGAFILIGCADGGGDAAAPAEESDAMPATEMAPAEEAGEEAMTEMETAEDAAAEGGEEAMTEMEPAEDAAEGGEEAMTEMEPADEMAADEGDGGDAEAAAEEAPAE